jgi:hypothetical protein
MDRMRIVADHDALQVIDIKWFCTVGDSLDICSASFQDKVDFFRLVTFFDEISLCRF